MCRWGRWRRHFPLRRMHCCRCRMQLYHISNYRERVWMQFWQPCLWNSPFLKHSKTLKLKLTTPVVYPQCEMPLCHTQLVISVSEFIIGSPHHLNEDRNILCVLAHMPPCHIENTGSHLYNSSVSPINSLSTGARQQMGKKCAVTSQSFPEDGSNYRPRTENCGILGEVSRS